MLEGVYDGGGIMMGRSGDNQQARGVIKGGRRAESWARLCSAHSEDRADSDHCQNEESDSERSSAPLRPLDLRTAHRVNHLRAFETGPRLPIVRPAHLKARGG